MCFNLGIWYKTSMVSESQRSKFQKVKAIPARGCIDWNRCSSASRPPLFVDGISSKKIMIRVEQIHTSCYALLLSGFLSVVSWTIRIFPLSKYLLMQNKNQHLDNCHFDMFMTKLSNQYRSIKIADNSDSLPCSFD